MVEEGGSDVIVRAASVDSMESRWVFQDSEEEEGEEEEEDDDDEPQQRQGGVPDYDDSAEQKLIRTGPRVDSFDVEALEVPGAQRNDYEDFSFGKQIVLAFQTLGVVFGDVGTSPLYTFSVMFTKAPINGNEDVLGALSLVIYTLVLIPVVKYVLVVLWANDDGEGGTFALYSLICRHAKVSLLPNQLPSDARISNFKLKVPSPELERSLKIKERLETSLMLKKLLLMLVLAGTSMVIADGVVTPVMSVMSAVGGLKVGVAPIDRGSEAMFADLCYFSVGSIQLTFVFLVLPCLLLGYLGQAAYLIENHTDYEQVFFSSIPSGVFWPVLLIANVAALIASRAMTTATFSCIKQSTALGCFPRLKIIHTSQKFMGQIYIPVMNWFLMVVCLVFVCTISSITEIGNAYGIAELVVMMMTTVLVTIVMLLIWQINIIVVLSFVAVFIGIELTFFSSVLWSVGDGSWIILVFAAVIFLIMYIWNYGSNLKYQTEVKQKLSMDLLRELGSNLGTVRAPGIGLMYNELVKGVPAIFGHFLTTLPAVHSMIIIVCIKYVPVPMVPQGERFLFRRVCPKSYHIFRCIARYGYKDVRKENHQAFEQLLIESLEKFIRREAQERSLESHEDDEDSDKEEAATSSRLVMAANGSMYSLDVPLLSEYDGHSTKPMQASEASTSAAPSTELTLDPEQSLERELSFIRQAKQCGVVYLLGHGDIRARKDSWFIKKLVINYFYAFLRKNCRRGIANLSVPHSHLMQVSMTYMV
ncbi:potassium transporter 7 isoform X3 [Punica granatum]|uniref:Potassium transporter 7 isoform X3 n=1 Tax=Punica granatum TaxID=22663 RepID=A0A218XRE0_PUNGR|nr:potassium transporter 7 isoform X3 [Punica granatum]OWM87755.1 hypothetical protein CDL15_Pgr016451 [Punica granatum]